MIVYYTTVRGVERFRETTAHTLESLGSLRETPRDRFKTWYTSSIQSRSTEHHLEHPLEKTKENRQRKD